MTYNCPPTSEILAESVANDSSTLNSGIQISKNNAKYQPIRISKIFEKMYKKRGVTNHKLRQTMNLYDDNQMHLRPILVENYMNNSSTLNKPSLASNRSPKQDKQAHTESLNPYSGLQRFKQYKNHTCLQELLD